MICLLALTLLAAGDDLAPKLEAVQSAPGFANGHWGVLVVDAKSGETVYQRNPDQLFCPASVTKVFSCAAAMAELGAEHRFVTPVVRRGEVDKEGTLRGDLILVAVGDPSLGGRTGKDGSLLFDDNDHTYAGSGTGGGLVDLDPAAGLDHLARVVRESGIKAVSGEILVDDRLFDPAPSTGSGPSKVSPILVNDNMLDFVVTPGAEPGQPCAVRVVPATAFAAVDARVETAPAGSKPKLEVVSAGPRRYAVRGKLPAGHKPVVRSVEVTEPAAFARCLLVEALRRRGVEVNAPSIGNNPAEALPARAVVAALPRVAEYTSPPLKESLRVILKVSHNLHASTLPMLLAAKHGERTLEQGLRREGAALRSLGVDTATISFGGGAGGSRSDLVTPRATVALLRSLSTRPDFPAFEAALPVLGRDGTLAKAVGPDSPARGHARAKTGTYWVTDELSGKAILTSKALAGTMETAGGRPLILAAFVNNVPLDAAGDDVSAGTAAAGRLLGRLVEVLYEAGGAAPKAGP